MEVHLHSISEESGYHMYFGNRETGKTDRQCPKYVEKKQGLDVLKEMKEQIQTSRIKRSPKSRTE